MLRPRLASFRYDSLKMSYEPTGFSNYIEVGMSDILGALSRSFF